MVFVMMSLLLGSAGCAPNGVTESTTTASNLNLKFHLEGNPGNPLSALGAVTMDEDATVYLAYGEAGGELSRMTPDTEVAAGAVVKLLVLGLYPGTWAVAPVVNGVVYDSQEITTTQPNGFTETTTVTWSTSQLWSDEEAFCVALYEPDVYSCTDREGRPTLFVQLPSYSLFGRPLMDGTIVAPPGKSGGSLVQFNTAGEVLDTVTMNDLSGFGYQHDDFDFHEVLQISEGQWSGAWVVLSTTTDVVEGAQVAGAGIIVFDPASGEVLWDWSSHGTMGDDKSIDEGKLPYSRTGMFQEGGSDWLHANAIVHGVDGAGEDYFLVSLCYQDWVIRVDAPSGEIQWRLGREGDFTLVDDIDAAAPMALSPELWMYQQHGPELKRLSDGRLELLLFDNGQIRAGENGEALSDNPYSRAVNFLIDEESLRASLLWSYGEPAPSDDDIYSALSGEVDRMPDEQSVLLLQALSNPPVSKQVSLTGELLWSQQYSSDFGLYRVEYYPSLYETTWWSETGW